MEHRKYYKKSSFSLADRARERRSQRINKAREENRLNILNSRRNIQEIETHATTVVPVSKASERAAKLAKWKAEKQRALAEQKKNQKPVFKVGILQRKATGSPLLKLTSSYANKNFLKPDQVSKVIRPSNIGSNIGVVTRAKAKALASGNQEIPKKDTKFSVIVNNKRKAIKNHAFTVPESVTALANPLKITLPQTPKVLKGRRNMKVRINESVKVLEGTDEKSVCDDEEKCEETTDMKDVAVEEMEKETKMDVSVTEEPVKEDTETNKSVTETSSEFVPIHYSPFVKSERGSDRKSPRRGKLNLTIDVDQLIEKEENEFKCRIFSFRKYVECQSKKLLDLCELWKNMTKTDRTIPSDVQDEILSLCGKTNLLTSDKFKQFKDLIDKCENKDPMIKIEDLQGYQDWVAIEVESLDHAFIKLEERRARNWKCETKVQVKVQKENRPVQAKKTGKFQGVRSNIRQHILAARKKFQNDPDGTSTNEDCQQVLKTPVKTPKKETSLLKDVLSSEAKKLKSPAFRAKNSLCNSTTKKRASGIEIIAATQIARTLTPGKVTSTRNFPVNSPIISS
ncbi:UNVERIFIED_CONTAM: hypothetical protein PYX00_001733 [Menopon gallinae]|uniref:Disks large-associated protein 5 n=1 Tax=Menopon gallinae TaxID=328185 RepID=A0AAW2IFD3_9NEOP